MRHRPHQNENRLAVGMLILGIFLIVLMVMSTMSHAQTIVDWEPQANGMMAIYWDRNHDGDVDLLTWHVVRWHGLSALPLTVLADQARRDVV